MKIRKSLIAGITAATVTAGLAAPAHAESNAVHIAAADAPTQSDALGSLPVPVKEGLQNALWYLILPIVGPIVGIIFWIGSMQSRNLASLK